MIKIIDDFLNQNEFYQVCNYCLNSPYFYGEKDSEETPPIGLVSNVLVESDFYKFFTSRLLEVFSEISEMKIYRMYINCFSPQENPYFHYDNENGKTILYYPNLNWEINDCGETQFLIDNEIKGILPIPNRLIIFDSNLLHRATSFRNKHRFSIAVKCN